MADVHIINHGSTVMVKPLTKKALDWIEANVQLEGWQWLGGAFACEPRYADDLISGMLGDDLEVE